MSQQERLFKGVQAGFLWKGHRKKVLKVLKGWQALSAFSTASLAVGLYSIALLMAWRIAL